MVLATAPPVVLATAPPVALATVAPVVAAAAAETAAETAAAVEKAGEEALKSAGRKQLEDKIGRCIFLDAAKFDHFYTPKNLGETQVINVALNGGVVFRLKSVVSFCHMLLLLNQMLEGLPSFMIGDSILVVYH